MLTDLVRITGIGDHLAATLDAVLAVEQVLQSQASWTCESSAKHVSCERSFMGRFCPRHAWQGHQCRQRCQLLGIGCDGETEAPDLVEEWLAGVFDPETLDELPYDLEERRGRLQKIASVDSRLSQADLVVCSHPTMLCVLLADVSDRPVFTHASSTLLFGLPCPECSEEGHGSTLRIFRKDSHSVSGSYLSSLRNLLLGSSAPRFALLAEGYFLSEQILVQAGVRVPWAPPLTLYVAAERWSGWERPQRHGLVLRSRFFATLAGEHVSSLLREMVAISEAPLSITIVGWQESYLSFDVIASYSAAVLWPNDIHQRTFHEVYRLGMPLFLPDGAGLYRLQRVVNWGYASYGIELQSTEHSFDEGQSSRYVHAYEPWWDSYSESPSKVLYWQQFADWEQMPHIQRFSSIPDLLQQLNSCDLEEISGQMINFHQQLTTETRTLIQGQVAAIMGAARDEASAIEILVPHGGKTRAG